MKTKNQRLCCAAGIPADASTVVGISTISDIPAVVGLLYAVPVILLLSDSGSPAAL